MQIKINGKTVSAEVLPVDKPTLDETLESFSFSLISNTNPMPYAPCQSVQVITDGNETINLFLVTDSVEVFSLNPQRFKHNITCVQNTRKLSKHLVRNSSFTTPAYIEKSSFSAMTYSLAHREQPEGTGPESKIQTSGTYDRHRYCDGIIEKVELVKLSNGMNINGIPERVKTAYVEIDMTGISCQKVPNTDTNIPYGESWWINDVKTKADIESRAGSIASSFTFHQVTLCYQRTADGTVHRETLTPAMLGLSGDWYRLNEKIRCTYIENLANQGYTIFWIELPYNSSLITGRTYPYYYPYWLAFMFQAKIILETYYYTAYDILYLLRLRQQKRRVSFGTANYDDALFELPTEESDADLYNLLTSTPAPNFTFTQSTMYECVAQVFSLFDAIFTMDANGVLGIEYFNDEIGRNRYDSGQNATRPIHKVGQNSASSEEKYTNGLVAYYQDARILENFPSDPADRNSFASIRTKDYGVPADQNDFVFEVPHPIESVSKCIMTIYNENFLNQAILFQSSFEDTGQDPYDPQEFVTVGTQLNPLYGFPLLDVTHYVVDKELWSNLDSDNTPDTNDPRRRIQINTVFFERGGTNIDISYTYKQGWWQTTQYAFDNMIVSALHSMCGDKYWSGTDFCHLQRSYSGSWDHILFKLAYYTSIDGRTKIESIDRKYDGETLIDQYNGAVDLNKMGLNILGLALKYGNPTLTVTQKITTWANRIKVGDIYTYENKKWVANVINYTFVGGYVQATIQFVQNFNALSMRTQLLRVKRMSNISSELTLKSEENIVEYIYFSISSTTDGLQWAYPRSQIALRTNKLAYSIAGSLGCETVYPSTPISSLIYIPEVATTKTSYQPQGHRIYVPMIKYGAGNSICFEMSYNHPTSAGKQTLSTYTQSWFTQYTSYFTKLITYAPEIAGTLPNVDIAIYPRGLTIADTSFPIIQPQGDADFVIDNLVYMKQPNEIFALNYQMTFLPMDKNKEFMGSKFINDNVLINGILRSPSDLKVWYGAQGDYYSVLDTKQPFDSAYVNVTSVEITTIDNNEHYFVIKLNLATEISAESFGICDKNDNVLFSANKPISTDTIYIAFFTTAHRVDHKILEDY